MVLTYREVDLYPLKVVSDAATETIDLNLTEPITELEIAIKVQNTGVVCDDVPPERIISKIEIVDGGKVYLSMAGLEAMAVATYEKGRWPTTWLYEGADGNQRAWIPIQFGRFLGDEKYSFNPRALLNPQLKITWAKDTLHLTNQVELGVFAKVMQGVPAVGEALMTRSIRTFQTADGGVEPTELPTDRPYRRLFIGGEKAANSIASIFSQYKLNCDVGKLIIFDLGQRKMIARCENEFGFFSYRKHDFPHNGRNVKTWLGRTMACSLDVTAVAVMASGYTTSGDVYTAYLYDDSGASQSDISAVAWLSGSFPQYILCYQFGRKDDPETWFNPSPYGQVKLELTQAIADADARILLQQPIRIP